MATASTSRFLQHMCQAVLQPEQRARSDGQLLDDFLLRREETAFRALVQRHGAMVLGVCRRILHNAHDAEDAFQATFLVLVRKAAALRQRETIGNYLYGVAYHTALKARAAVGKRRAKESQAMRPAYEETDRDAMLDLWPLLDQELNRLPDRYRAAVVLCHLEGRPRPLAARQLGIPEGTLSSRLATARRLLAKRLARHGLLLSAGALASVLSPETASARVALPLAKVTVRAATLVAAGQAAGVVPAHVAALMEGVLQTMQFSRLKIALIVLFASTVLAAGVGVIMRPPAQAGAAEQSPARVAESKPVPPEDKHRTHDDSLPDKLAPEPPPPDEVTPPPKPSRDRLDALLRSCEAEMKKVRSVRAHLTRTTTDRTSQATSLDEGTFQYRSPNQALLELHPQGGTGVFEKIVCAGTSLYEYDARQKVIRVHQLPLSNSASGQPGDLLSLLAGLNVDEARQRYDIRLVKEDPSYAYIEIRPRLPQDKATFKRARLVLTTSTFLPRQLWFAQPNGNEVKWDISRIERDVRLDRTTFDAPTLLAGWRMEQMPTRPVSRP